MVRKTNFDFFSQWLEKGIVKNADEELLGSEPDNNESVKEG